MPLHRGTVRAANLLPVLRLLLVSAVSGLPQHFQDEYGLTALAKRHSEGSADAESHANLWVYLGSAAVLVLLGGAFAGLTIALMGQDEIYLQVIATSGEGPERKHAAKVLNLLKKGKHWVLVALLLANVITNETLPIMLDRSLGGGWQAVIGSTVLIVIFGEIVPQSVCVRFGLPIGAVMAPFVLLLMWISAPVAWPIAKLLDFLLGEDHGTTYKKAGLKTLVTLHRTMGTSADERLNKDEVTIISAVLDLKEKQIGSIMTPMEDVYTLSADAILDEDMIDSILTEGYSRIPIHAVNDPDNFIGMLLVKMLIAYDPEDCLKVHDFQLATLPETRPETSCLDIINFFQEGKSHMILVSESPGEPQGVLGVVTLEDVIEELIGEEIVDESDVFVDVHKAIRRMHHVPYYRVPKPSLGDIKENGQDQDGASVSKPVTGATTERKLSAMSDSIPHQQSTRLFRRKNSAGTEPFNVSRKPDDIRAHLKHLGPSNLASRPKTTRFNTVKIKPAQQTPSASGISPTTSKVATGDNTRPQMRMAATSSRSHREEVEAVQKALELQAQAEESTGLLSAGFTASDAVHAVGYGTLSGSGSPMSNTENIVRSAASQPSPLRQSQGTGSKKPTNGEPGEQDQSSNSQAPKESASEPPDQKPSGSARDESREGNVSPRSSTVLPAKLVVDLDNTSSSSSEDEATKEDEESSGNTVSSTPSAGGTRRSGARSGSIHERGIDLGGLRKVVLDVRQELDDVDEDAAAEASGGPDVADELEDVAETAALLTQEAGDKAKKAKRSKKKKRTKKKKAGAEEEEELETGEASEGVRLLK